MKRAALLLLPAIAVATSAGQPETAAAKSKSFCRGWAQEVADREANAPGSATVPVLGAADVTLVGAVTAPGQVGVEADSLTAATAEPTATDNRREQAYRRAYADCRAS